MAEQRQWVQADLQCLQCGRVLGRLAGPCQSGSRVGAGYAFSVFRPSDPRQSLRGIQGNERFHCDMCGGNAFVDEFECFTTYDEPEEVPVARHRGRPPTPMRRTTDRRLVELGLAS